MRWNLETSALIELLDDRIIDIKTDSEFFPGHCETCDFGQMFVQSITVMFEDGDTFTCRIENESEYLCDEGNMIKFFTNNVETFANMSRDEFCDLLERLEIRESEDKEILEIFDYLTK